MFVSLSSSWTKIWLINLWMFSADQAGVFAGQAAPDLRLAAAAGSRKDGVGPAPSQVVVSDKRRNLHGLRPMTCHGCASGNLPEILFSHWHPLPYRRCDQTVCQGRPAFPPPLSSRQVFCHQSSSQGLPCHSSCHRSFQSSGKFDVSNASEV